jgi:ethanolamine utilization microcompartment shell protein EutS
MPQLKNRTGVAAAQSPSSRVGATAEPTSTPTPVETAVPVAASAPKHVAITRLPSDAAPLILSVAVSETTVHSGDTVSGTVLTTSNVASVEVRIATFGKGLSKVGVGRFTLTYPVGNLPFFLRGTYAMRVIARNTAGDSTETSVPITVR